MSKSDGSTTGSDEQSTQTVLHLGNEIEKLCSRTLRIAKDSRFSCEERLQSLRVLIDELKTVVTDEHFYIEQCAGQIDKIEEEMLQAAKNVRRKQDAASGDQTHQLEQQQVPNLESDSLLYFPIHDPDSQSTSHFPLKATHYRL